MDPATDPGLEEVVAERFDAADGPCRGPLAGFAAAGLNDATGRGTGLGVATRKAPARQGEPQGRDQPEVDRTG